MRTQIQGEGKAMKRMSVETVTRLVMRGLDEDDLEPIREFARPQNA